jgi:tetratricopeptide (TPR) repeat protein
VTTTIDDDAPPPARPASQRAPGLRLARVHLRMGSLVLARAELEAYAGRGELDDEAILDLAEARWRTGDLAGAGEVATAAIQGGSADPLALIIAAEAVAALGRPGEARRLAGRALESVHGSLDPLFAGMPRSLIWPTDPDAPVPGGDGADGGHRPSAGAAPDALQALDAGREALDRGEHAAAAVRLGVALRLGPAFAPAILDALGDVHQPELELVRGDAYRLVGREVEARRSYSAVLRQLAVTSAAGAGAVAAPALRSEGRVAPVPAVEDDEPVLPSSVVPAHPTTAKPAKAEDAKPAKAEEPKALAEEPTPPAPAPEEPPAD